MTIEKYFRDWIKVLPVEEMIEALDKVKKLGKPICPMTQDIFRAFTMLNLSDLRVVFLGQDPYPDIYKGKPRATGILFGNRTDVDEEDLSPSLKVIKEAAINFEIPHNIVTFDNSLEGWARQGVLMINSALTCEVNKVGSHTMIWRPFIKNLLNRISICDHSVIFVLFGETAHTFAPYLSGYNEIMLLSHPAYYARIGEKMPNIFFHNINALLNNMEGRTINWYCEEKFN